MIPSKFKISIASTFLWIGFVCAISFMEAWLKFRAPGVTIPIGLGIGRLVFTALNLVEWVFALVIISNLLFSKTKFITLQNTLYFIPLLILIIETFWALPALDTRAELYIQGQKPPASNLHFYYVGMEIIKVACLTIFGIKLFNKS
ncbi:hypothetical protein [uncultured Flavobacterium sp.]|uniref:hypothetical protein n=1 Tax=uncultured Flavobacterium sp. TaxID=165435 RepID=UPI0030EC11F1|tara:strand:+ start:237778 stop:238215 length:438 start_codon:yes stop_codon:yes gene_type:complete